MKRKGMDSGDIPPGTFVRLWETMVASVPTGSVTMEEQLSLVLRSEDRVGSAGMDEMPEVP